MQLGTKITNWKCQTGVSTEMSISPCSLDFEPWGNSVHKSKKFLDFLKAPIPTPVVPLLQLWDHFAKLFGGDAASGISDEIAANLTKIEQTPFNPSEIKVWADQMKLEKSSALTTF